MAVNGKVELNDLQKEIAHQIAQEKAEDQMMLANFDDTLPNARNPLANTTRSTRLVNHVNQKDNMLKYQVSDDKEENELLEDIMGSTEQKAASIHKDGDLISTDQVNKTQLLDQPQPF